MKLRIFGTLIVFGIACAWPLPAADLSPLVAEAAKYESGRNRAPLQQFEQLLRESAGKPARRAELEGALMKLLVPSATFEARRFACQQLGAFGTESSLPALAELLKQDDTAGLACLALSTSRLPAASEALRNALPAARGLVRLQLISALGNHQDQTAGKTLIEFSHNGDSAVASAAIIALGKVGGAEAQTTIAALLNVNQPAVSAAVAEAVLRMIEQLAGAGDRKAAAALAAQLGASSPSPSVRRGAFSALLRLDQDGGEQRILETLRSQDPLLTPVAIAAVGALKSRGTSEKFAHEMSSLGSQQQARMIEALAARGDATARSAIRHAADSSDATVRLAAVAALGRLNDIASVPLLCAALAQAQTAAERQAIAVALAQMRGASADKTLFAQLKRANGDARVELIGLAGRRGNRAAVPILLAESGSADTATAKAAFQALANLAIAADLPPYLEKLMTLQAAGAREAAENAVVRALEKVTDPARRITPLEATLAKTADGESRCSLLRLMPACGGPKALAVLAAALKGSDERIRETALRALAEWPEVSAWDTLAAICRQPEKETFRVLAWRGLVQLAESGNPKPDAPLMVRYRQLLDEARSDTERKLVLGALGGAASPDALQLAVGQLSYAAVRAETSAAVKKIATAIKAEHPAAAQAALQRLKGAK